MKPRALLIITSILALITGIVFIALRGTVMGIAGAMGAGVIAQVLGANFLGFAALNFFAKNLTEGEGLRAVLLANFTSNVFTFLVILVYGLTSGSNTYGWIAAAISLILTLAFGIYLVYQPRQAAAPVPCPQEPC